VTTAVKKKQRTRERQRRQSPDVKQAADGRVDPARCIRVRGAREHNLRSIDVDIPRDKLVVITGLSGSGKSSLAFDTIFAEGQRKYMESLSAYARQFLDVLRKPDVDDIEGLPPTIAIEQRAGGHNPRSTVATSTEIYDYLRLLFARCGTPTCWKPMRKKRNGAVSQRCGERIEASGATQIVDTVMAKDDGARMLILGPVVRAKKGFHRYVLEDLQKQGFVRARVNGVVVDLRDALKEGGDNPLALGRHEKHTIEAVVDRVLRKADARQRIAESIETALHVGEGVVVVSAQPLDNGDTWTDNVYSEKHACATHPQCAIEEIEPRLFSFNSPFGACKACSGLGAVVEFDEAGVLPDDSRSLQQGAIRPWAKAGPIKVWYARKLRRFCKQFGVAYKDPVRTFPKDVQHVLLYGSTAKGKGRSGSKWEGVIPALHAWWNKTESDFVKEWLSQYMVDAPCPDCLSDRLRVEALGVFIETTTQIPASVAARRALHGFDGSPTRVNIADFSRLTIAQARAIIAALSLTPEQETIAAPIVREVGARLGFLESVGLEYLSLDRKMGTLSGGEAQRIRLGTQVGSKLVGACYVLDEPTIGLHQRDNERLIRTLRHLADIGNTVMVVEHDEGVMQAADHIVDIGPGPGVHGGLVVAQGTIADLKACEDSLTGAYLARTRTIETPAQRRKLNAVKRAIVVKGARQHNLKSIDVAFPLGGIVCVTGVSGSGKSTLVNEILLRAARKAISSSRDKPGAHTRVTGLGQIDRVIEVDQSPIGRTPRSNPATYTGVFDDIRKLFTQAKEAKIRGYKPGRFSFNVKGGRCEACQGQGVKRIEMHFLPDVFVECEVCKGDRYNRETLEVSYRGRTIADVLELTVEDACAFFENHPKILRQLTCLRDVGLDYVQLGQRSTTLSGGEAQRIKLASELGRPGGARSLYILDEPTTGLHFEDIRKLLGVFNRLADIGATLVVIEHNLDVIKCADWIIDLGPEGGDRGGALLATGTPEQVAKVKTSSTGQFLRNMLDRNQCEGA